MGENIQMTLTGFLGSDPELVRAEKPEHDWVRFRVGSTPSYRDDSGNWVSGQTVWVTCKAWGALARNINNSLSKGAKVFLRGKVALNKWGFTDENNVVHEREDIAVHVSNIGPDLTRHVAKAKLARTAEQKNADFMVKEEPPEEAPAKRGGKKAKAEAELEAVPF